MKEQEVNIRTMFNNCFIDVAELFTWVGANMTENNQRIVLKDWRDNPKTERYQKQGYVPESELLSAIQWWNRKGGSIVESLKKESAKNVGYKFSLPEQEKRSYHDPEKGTSVTRPLRHCVEKGIMCEYAGSIAKCTLTACIKR